MRERKLIGLVGLARSGKDSAAGYLGFKSAAFAEPLKAAAQHIFDLSYNEVHGINCDRESPHPFWGISIREILQKLGTESVRDVFGQDHWAKLMELRLTQGDLTGADVVITDLRFEEEVDLIRHLGGKIMGVIRTEGQPDIRHHPSEEMAALRLHEVCDDVIEAANLEELQRSVISLTDHWYA